MVAKRISPTVVTYNALICSLCIMDQLKDAIGLSHKMILENINQTVTVYSFNILVDAFSKEGKMKQAKAVVTAMMKKGAKPCCYL